MDKINSSKFALTVFKTYWSGKSGKAHLLLSFLKATIACFSTKK
jgi:hypothetical protein